MTRDRSDHPSEDSLRDTHVAGDGCGQGSERSEAGKADASHDKSAGASGEQIPTNQYTVDGIEGLHELTDADETECLDPRERNYPEFEKGDHEPPATDGILELKLEDLDHSGVAIEDGHAEDIEKALEALEVSEVTEMAFLNGTGRLAKTIMDRTGWTFAETPAEDEPQFCPVLTDGTKNYRFDAWKIYITFREIPGIAVLDWSPETLDHDLDRARGIDTPEDHNVERMAEILSESFSPEQLQDLCELLQTRLR